MRIRGWILAVIVLLFGGRWSLTAFATNKPYEFAGHGTEYDPYLITSYEDLCELRNIVDDGNNLDNIWFKQTSDIQFPNGELWNPIGDASAGLPFSGYYDGNGHMIIDIRCNDKYGGFFSLLTGEVRNLGIDSGCFQGNCVGAITSHGAGKIINCYNKAEIITNGRAGGIADNFSGIVMFCINMGDVRGGVEKQTEPILTAGLISYGTPYIAYCYDAGNGKLINDSTFGGNIIESDVFSSENAETIMDNIYKHMWEVYSADGALPDSDKNVPINRGNTVFMRWIDETIAFDAEYEPDLFRTEKEKNKEAFLSVYNTRFDFEGSGTKEDPFQISSYEDLCHLRDCVDIGISYRNYYFIQICDIYFPDNDNWDPIGSVKDNLPYSGIYDGNGHCIFNISCKDPYAGLFSLLCGSIKNLGIESGKFIGGCAGSITSHGDGSIINCYNKADVIGERAGGLTDNYSGLILFSWNLGKISGTSKEAITAGISSYGAARIEYCYSTSDIPLIDTKFFKGSLVESQNVKAEKIKDNLNIIYRMYNKYDENKDADLDDIIYMVASEDSLNFDATYAASAVKSTIPRRYLVEIILLIVCVVEGFSIIVFLFKSRNTSKCMNNKKTFDTVHHRKKVFCIQYTISVVLTCSILFTCGYWMMHLLNSKSIAGILNLKFWEKEENANTDILFLGSSTMSVNVEMEELWRNYGIAGYCLGGGLQSMYDKYYRLIEAEKYHPVSMLIIDARASMYTQNYSSLEAQEENISGLKWSINKLNYVQAAVDSKQRLNFFLEFPLYHNRYMDITKWDYMNSSVLGTDDKGTWTIFYGNKYSPTIRFAGDITNYLAIDEKEEYYFRKIIEYCQNQGIELLIIKTPAADLEKYQPIYNTAEIIAEEYGVPFLNFNFYNEKIGLVASDFYYDANHLNVTGARKCADFLGEYLVSHYDLADHRGDADYASWDRFAANRENLYLRAITEKDDYFAELVRDEKSVMAVPYRLPESKSEAYLSMQEQLQSVRHFDWDKEDILYGEENAESFIFGDNTVVITKDYGNCRIDLNDGEDVINVTQPGMLLVVYDSINDEIADMVLLERDSGYTLKHLYSP